MKKTLLLTTLLSSILFAQSNSEQTANMSISAQVIQPLKVEVTQNIDLGKIIAGTTSIAQGEFKITGEPESRYFAYIKELGPTVGDGPIELINEDNPTLKLPVHLWSDIFPSLGARTLTDGENFNTIEVHANVPNGQPSGQYKSKITLVVRYE